MAYSIIANLWVYGVGNAIAAEQAAIQVEKAELHAVSAGDAAISAPNN